MTKTEERIAYFSRLGVIFLNKMPDGWKVTKGALTAPNGYLWIHGYMNPLPFGDCRALLKLKK